jgi:flavin-dependent dehydrogenase
VWGYWKGAKGYGYGTDRQGSPMIESLHGELLQRLVTSDSTTNLSGPDNTGWAWYIPINDDSISVGFVMHEEFVHAKKAGKSTMDFYLDQFQHLVKVNELKGDATILPSKDGEGSSVYMASDYSYASDDVGKLNYRIVGDSAGMQTCR